MKYRKQAQETSEGEAFMEELVHGIAGGAESGAPEILPELLQGKDADESIWGWSITPLGKEARNSAQEVARSYTGLRRRLALRALLRAMWAARSTRRRVVCWGIVLLVTTLFNAFAGAVMTYGQSWIQKSQETLDVESFWMMLPLWVSFTLTDLVMDTLQNQSTWELRMILQRQLSFSLTHSLFMADCFYHLQTNATGAAPETLICEDAFILVKQLTGFITGVLRTSSSLFFSAWLLYFYYPRLLWTGLLIVPVFLWVTGKASGELTDISKITIAIRGVLHFCLSRVQSNAEEIAFCGGGVSELRSCEETLEFLRHTGTRHSFRNAFVEVVIHFTSFMLFLPIIWILAEEVFDKGMTFTEAMMYFSLSTTVMFGWASIAALVASAIWAEMLADRMLHMVKLSQEYERVAGLRSLTALAEAASGKQDDMEDLVIVRETDIRAETVLEMHDVELRLDPSKVLLCRNLSFHLRPGESMLVLGKTGIGKSTLLRAIQGLWPSGSGTVQRCKKDAVTCVPQKPFMFFASLRENLLYPTVERALYVPDSELWEALEAVNLKLELSHFSLDKPMPWQDILSLGQQQRVGFARALLKRNIRLLLLDEATSALDMRNEGVVYRLLKDRFPCYVSAAHRRSVQQYHTHVLMMEPTPSEESRSEARFVTVDECGFGACVSEASEAPVAASAAPPLTTRAPPAPAEPASAPAATGAPEEEERLLSGGPSIAPPSTMITLMRRISFDIVMPIIWRRAFWLQVRWYLFIYFLASLVSALSVAMFIMPLAQMEAFTKSGSREGLWSMIFYRGLEFVPVYLFISFAFQYCNFMLTRIIVVELQLFFVRLYFKNNMFYHLLLEGNVKDPAGRFTLWDFRSLVSFYQNTVHVMASALLGNLTLIGLVLEADDEVVMSILKVIVTYMIAACIGFIIAFLPTYTLYSKWIYESTRLHANLVHIHGHAEAVALLQGGDVEKRRAFLMLDKCIDLGQNYVWMRDYAMPIVVDGMFDRTTKIALACMLYPLVISGQLSASMGFLVSTAAWKTMEKVLGIANVFVGSPEGFASMSRIWELAAEMERLRALRAEELTGRKQKSEGIILEQNDNEETILELCDLTLRTPSRMSKVTRPLLQGVSLHLAPGEKLVITGPSGIGKTSLLRATAGLWSVGTGTVRRASNARSYFIAQRPYVCIGSLRHQLLYPRVMRSDVPRERLEEVVRQVHLEHLLEEPGLKELGSEAERRSQVSDSEDRWWGRLSLGEVQRLSFARLLLQDRLRVAFLDEATSALSPGTESDMYALLREHLTSYISVAHRPEARDFHSHMLELGKGPDEGSAEWRVLSIEDRKSELNTQ